MSLTYTECLGDGTTTVFSFSFAGVGKGYIREEDIQVTVGGSLTGFILQGESTLAVTPAPANGAIVLIRRIMPYEEPYSTFTRGNNFGQDNINHSFEQTLYVVQEILDGYFPADWSFKGDLNMGGNRIVSLGKPIYNDDAVRFIDLQGGDGEFTGVGFLDGTGYLLLDNPLPAPVIAGEIFEMTTTCKFKDGANTRVILAETEDLGSKGSVQLNANLTIFSIEDSLGVVTNADITALSIPINEEIVLKIQSKYDGANFVQRISYEGGYSAWLSGGVEGAWRKIFGAGESLEGALLTAYTLQYSSPYLLNTWNLAAQSGVVVASTFALYRGELQGTEGVAWEATDPDDTGLSVITYAENVIFNPDNSNFGEDIIDVDKALKDIDANFIRTVSGEVDPNPPDGTIIQAYTTWLADTTIESRTRPLVANPNEGAEVRIRDDAGFASTNHITVQGNGTTIMGLSEDLKISSDWAWVTLKYFSDRNDWRVVEGGIGAQVVYIPDIPEPPVVEPQELYPLGYVLLSVDPQNPFLYLDFGTWERIAEGQFLSGIGSHVDLNGVNKTLVAGENGGEWEHTITKEELPSDANQLAGDDVVVTNAPFESPIDPQSGASPSGHEVHIDAWGDDAMNVTNPSFAVYMWKRIF